MLDVKYKTADWRKIEPDSVIQITAGTSTIKGRVTEIIIDENHINDSKLIINNGITVLFGNINWIWGPPLEPATKYEAVIEAINKRHGELTGFPLSGGTAGHLAEAALDAVRKWDEALPVEATLDQSSVTAVQKAISKTFMNDRSMAMSSTLASKLALSAIKAYDAWCESHDEEEGAEPQAKIDAMLKQVSQDLFDAAESIEHARDLVNDKS